MDKIARNDPYTGGAGTALQNLNGWLTRWWMIAVQGIRFLGKFQIQSNPTAHRSRMVKNA